jgi:hypothetical protein
MVALATIFAQLVAKATSISESAGESILARGKKYANYPRNLTAHSGERFGNGIKRLNCVHRAGEAFSPARYFFVAKIVVWLLLLGCPRKESTLATI